MSEPRVVSKGDDSGHHEGHDNAFELVPPTALARWTFEVDDPRPSVHDGPFYGPDPFYGRDVVEGVGDPVA